MVSIQPWSSSSETNIPSSPSPSPVGRDASHDSYDTIDQTLEELFSLNPEPQPVAENELSTNQTWEENAEDIQPNENETTETQEETMISSNGLLVSSSVPFSFSIERHRKEDAAREKVDLPSFLRRQ